MISVDSSLFEEYCKLVDAFKAGDETAYEQIYEKSQRLVYTTCRGILQNDEDAFDAMQDTYLTVYQKIGSLDDSKSFVSWLKRIATTKSLDLYKKRKGDVSYDDAVASDESLQLDDNLENLPDSYIMEKTKREALEKILRAELTDVQYQTIHMHYFSEYSVETIAEMMDCPVGTVKTRLMKSRAKIKEGVRKYEKKNKDAFVGAPTAGIPFLTRFFNTASQNLKVPHINIATLIGDGVSKAGKGASITKAITSSTTKSTVKAGFFTTVAGKITVAALSLAVITTSTIAIKKLVEDVDKDIVETTEESVETIESIEIEVTNISYTDEVNVSVDVNVLNMNDHSYACYYGFSTWEEAQEYCESLDGYLAVISSQEENDALYSFATSQGYDNVYFGFSDNTEEGVWQWVNGETLEYSNWNAGEPNAFTDDEDYAVFSENRTWNDGCFNPRIENGLVCFICEWDYYVTGVSNIEAEDLVYEIVVNEQTFPDSYFRNYVLSHFDTDNNGVLSPLEIEVISTIDFVEEEGYTIENIFDMINNDEVTHGDCTNLIGIEHFYNLTYLDCSFQSITYLDLSYNSQLLTLVCRGNYISDLDISCNEQLLELECEHNSLTNIDVSNNTYITYLGCNSNMLANIDLSNNSYLTSLACNNNEIDNLDLSNNSQLIRLYCENNRINSIDLEEMQNLEWITCSDNQLVYLDVSNCPNLGLLDCHNNQLSSIDISNNGYLLEAYYNTTYPPDAAMNRQDDSLIYQIENSLYYLRVDSSTTIIS